MKANAETNLPAVQTAGATPDLFDLFDLDGWVVEMDDRTGSLYDQTTSLNERVGELEEFAVLIFQHARLTHRLLADLHRALKQSKRYGGKRRK
jgi:hypothetical protein